MLKQTLGFNPSIPADLLDNIHKTLELSMNSKNIYWRTIFFNINALITIYHQNGQDVSGICRNKWVKQYGQIGKNVDLILLVAIWPTQNDAKMLNND